MGAGGKIENTGTHWETVQCKVEEDDSVPGVCLVSYHEKMLFLIHVER